MRKLIIPVRSSDFDLGQEFATVPESMAYLQRLNIVEISNDYFEASIKKIAECVEHRDRDQSYAGDEEAGNSAMPEENDGDKKND